MKTKGKHEDSLNTLTTENKCSEKQYNEGQTIFKKLKMSR